MKNYLVATVKPWNVDAWHRRTKTLPGKWRLVQSPTELEAMLSQGLKPRYVFFPHWSWQVPNGILAAAECVCFHMTDVPFGRGGSPLQNLIARGLTSTKISALRMVEELDAGPVYLKKSLSLGGRAQDIYERAAEIIYDMIEEIVATEPEPRPQQGPAVAFARRTPDQSRLPPDATPKELFDHIRMLDAETYPRAFVEYGRYRLEFCQAKLEGSEVTARVVVKRG